jgi:asparagine synthase (glutamine-hydrolysing)
MCGILGTYQQNPKISDQAFLDGLKLIEHRGPDDTGLEKFSLQGGDLRFGHNRLSIIELSSLGHQPMNSACKNFCITYNGEIYNFQEIRNELENLGIQFESNSDTEVLLAAWIQWEEECLNKFIGMFSFAIFNKLDSTIFCAVDQFSIKPFYYLLDNTQFIFSSEIAPITNLADSPCELDLQAAYEYLAYGNYDIADRTFINSIKRIKPGHFMKIKIDDLSSATQKRYWWPSIAQKNISFDDAKLQLKLLFEDSIRMHLISDVKVAAALSGGVDSSSIVCAMNIEMNQETFNTFTYAAEDSSINEEKWASLVTDATKTINHKISATSAELARDLDDLIITLGEPFASTSTYAQYQVFKNINQKKIKVSLDGQGADEIFAGYQGFPAHRALSYAENFDFIGLFKFLFNWSRWPGRSFFSGIFYFFSLSLTPKSKNFFLRLINRNPHLKWLNIAYLKTKNVNIHSQINDLEKLNKKNYKEIKGRRLIAKLRYETCNGGLVALLRLADRVSMRWSIESRVPFLNKDIVEFAFSLPEEYLISNKGRTKNILREALSDLVPEQILERRDKIGFRTSDKELFLDLSKKIEDYFFIAKKIPFLNYDECILEFKKNIQRNSEIDASLWRVLNMCRWLHLHPKIKIPN